MLDSIVTIFGMPSTPFWLVRRIIPILFDDSLPVLRRARREGIRHVYGIHKPDSRRPELDHDEFPLVEDFGDLLPGFRPR